MKCCHAVVNGEGRDVYKQPITDPDKHSQSGRLALIQDTSTGALRTVRADSLRDSDQDLLEPVFRDGEILRDMRWDEVLAQAAMS